MRYYYIWREFEILKFKLPIIFLGTVGFSVLRDVTLPKAVYLYAPSGVLLSL